MIVEQNKLFGIIPVSRAKEVKPGSQIVLQSKDVPDNPFIREVVRSVQVHDNDRVSFKQQIKGTLVTFQNETPEEVNKMGIKTRGIVQRVFTFKPKQSMIFEQKRLFGIIPLSRSRPVKKGELVPLAYHYEPGKKKEMVNYINVLGPNYIILKIYGSFWNDPRKLNEFRVSTGKGAVKKVYRYRENSAAKA